MAKKLLCLIIVVVLCLCSCSAQPDTIPVFEPINLIWDETSIDTIKENDGKPVTVAGYISVLSPYNGEYLYIMSTPLDGFTDSDIDGTFNNILLAKPPSGCAFNYTEKCVTVKGVIKFEKFTDAFNVTHNWYIDECTYVLNNNTEAIKLYNDLVDTNVLGTIDSWLGAIADEVTKEQPEEGDIEYTPIDITTFESTIAQSGINNEQVLALCESLKELSSSFNTWLETKTENDINSIMEKFNATKARIQEWISSNKVKGNEVS